ncbi:MAG TPA: cysteine-rich CWC family protein [Sporosarcina sp.]|nr:cysteine-rich CWC family protein [Sporosarcina sp.]
MDETKQCPICKQENKCGTHVNENPSVCWCAFEAFPKEIFELVPDEKIRKACICATCLATVKQLSTS